MAALKDSVVFIALEDSCETCFYSLQTHCTILLSRSNVLGTSLLVH